jgi:hypothetical protein
MDFDQNQAWTEEYEREGHAKKSRIPGRDFLKFGTGGF